jgi:dTDP-glucose 4,6-dehydratase
MRLLVTGGLGFIGSNFIRHMLATQRGVRIVNLDLCTYAGNPASLEDVRKSCGERTRAAAGPVWESIGARYRWVRGDIADPRVVDRCMQGADAVVHFAAETHVDRSILDAAAFLRTNVIGTQVLLDAALRHKIGRFVHVSTDEVYGSVATGLSREGDPLEPNSPYAASKAASDLLVRSYVVTHGLPAVITRASNNFGPYQYPEKALPLMISNWIDGEPFPLYGDGRNVRDWLFVLDHARALALVLRRGRVGEVYNIGGTYSCSNRQLLEQVRRIMGVGPELVRRVPDRPGHDRRYALDCSRLKALGFRHAYGFSQALAETVAWYRAHESWWRPLKKGGGYRQYYKRQYAARLTEKASR